MNKFDSFKNLCKEVALDVVAPYKHTNVEEVLSLDEIGNIEKSAKCTVIAINNVVTNVLMITIEVLKSVCNNINDSYVNYMTNVEEHKQILNDDSDDKGYEGEGESEDDDEDDDEEGEQVDEKNEDEDSTGTHEAIKGDPSESDEEEEDTMSTF